LALDQFLVLVRELGPCRRQALVESLVLEGAVAVRLELPQLLLEPFGPVIVV